MTKYTKNVTRQTSAQKNIFKKCQDPLSRKKKVGNDA